MTIVELTHWAIPATVFAAVYALVIFMLATDMDEESMVMVWASLGVTAFFSGPIQSMIYDGDIGSGILAAIVAWLAVVVAYTIPSLYLYYVVKRCFFSTLSNVSQSGNVIYARFGQSRE